jgi:hypothetical protein
MYAIGHSLPWCVLFVFHIQRPIFRHSHYMLCSCAIGGLMVEQSFRAHSKRDDALINMDKESRFPRGIESNSMSMIIDAKLKMIAIPSLSNHPSPHFGTSAFCLVTFVPSLVESRRGSLLSVVESTRSGLENSQQMIDL